MDYRKVSKISKAIFSYFSFSEIIKSGSDTFLSFRNNTFSLTGSNTSYGALYFRYNSSKKCFDVLYDTRLGLYSRATGISSPNSRFPLSYSSNLNFICFSKFIAFLNNIILCELGVYSIIFTFSGTSLKNAPCFFSSTKVISYSFVFARYFISVISAVSIPP